MKRALTGFAVLLSVLFAIAQRPSQRQIAYSYRLPIDATNTTLGIKDSTGALVRTIFRGKVQRAGTYSGVWDGNTDSGVPASDGPFTVVLLYGNPVYTWEGMVGNTSNQWEGLNRWETFYESLPLARITFVDNVGWTTQGLSEGTLGLGYFNDTDPNTPKLVSPYYSGPLISLVDIATDGRDLYALSASRWPGASTFATKFDAHTGRPSSFTSGKSTVGLRPGTGGTIRFAYPGTTMSAIDVNPTTTEDVPTAIAVQTGGILLAIGHGNFWNGKGPDSVLRTNNVIRFFDKVSGLPAGHNVTLANPISMAFSPAGLWVVANNGLYLVSSPSTQNKITQPISGLSSPVAVDVNKSNGHIYVLDGGNSQQLKEYDTSYKLLRTYGQLGGYTDCNPTVTHDRLMIDNKAITGTTVLHVPALAAVRSETNGDVWITDTLDNGQSGRLQHLTPSDSTFKYVDQVQFASETYSNGVSHTQPTRLFIGMLEYTIDYSVPNKPGDPTRGGNNFWHLTRAWTVGAGGACGSKDIYGMTALTHPPAIVGSEKLSNGHVYAVMLSTFNGTTLDQREHLLELPLSGTSPFRFIKTLFPFRVFRPMDRNGDFRNASFTHGGTASRGAMNIIPLTGFDGSSNPIYGPEKTIVSWTFNENTQPYPHFPWNGINGTNYEPTTGGVYAIQRWNPYDSTKTTNYPHIGGVLPNRSSYLFTVNPEVCGTTFLTDGSYPCSTGSGNLGTGILTEGRHIISVYGSQASIWEPQFWHYWEDGMFIGQFGPQMMNDGTPTVTNGTASSRLAGTSTIKAQASDLAIGQDMGAAQLIGVNGDLYLHVMSESNHTPNQVWHITNLSSIHEIAGTGNLGSSVNLSKQVW
jgi:hypothetical protein